MGRSGNPLAVTPGFRAFVLDQLAGCGEVTPRSMFGGVGLYAGEFFFGIIAGDTLYLKVDDTNRGDFEAAGAKPFKPYPHRSGTMQYYSVPVTVLEDADALAEWASKAIRVAGGATKRDKVAGPLARPKR